LAGEDLIRELRDAGYCALERMVCCVAARRALEEGRAGDAERSVLRALELKDCVDAWADEPARAWAEGAVVMAAVGDTATARRCVDEACAWIEATGASWESSEDRDRWRAAHPLHRRLLAPGPG
jgi:hypothetical protein